MADIKFPPMPKAHTVVKPKDSEPFGLITTRDALNFAAEAVRLNAQAVPCDCTTEIHADGTRKTWCGSDQMRRAIADGHAFAAAPATPQPLTDEQRKFLLFLDGSGEWDGVWFREPHHTKPGAYWWREDMHVVFHGIGVKP